MVCAIILAVLHVEAVQAMCRRTKEILLLAAYRALSVALLKDVSGAKDLISL